MKREFGIPRWESFVEDTHVLLDTRNDDVSGALNVEVREIVRGTCLGSAAGKILANRNVTMFRTHRENQTRDVVTETRQMYGNCSRLRPCIWGHLNATSCTIYLTRCYAIKTTTLQLNECDRS